jgi:hypothetical protein
VNAADPALDTRIAEFAAAVRARLDDLDPEDVDDLTGGLEADLQEEAADHDGALALGDPARYADELRTSAGLPERAVDASDASPLAQLQAGARERGRALLTGIRGNRELSAILDLLLAFRPVWWLLRAWAGYQCFVVVLFGGLSLLPRNPAAWILLIALTVISVQWGRGRWVRSAPARALKAVVSAITAIALVVLIPVAIDDMVRDPYAEASYSSPYEQPGLSLDGKQITNLFAYDAEGDLLDRVQLFDQDGDPLTTIGSAADGAYDPSSGEEVPPSEATWNVFPLDARDASVVSGEVTTGSGPVRPPFAKALPLDADPDATPTPEPTSSDDAEEPADPAAPGVTPAPEATPAAGATP